MASDMFIVFDAGSDIKGETEDAEFKSKNGIEVLSWSWGASQTGSVHSGTGAGAGKASVQDFTFTMVMNKASVALQKALMAGVHIKTVEFMMRKAGTKPYTYFHVTMTDCIITSFQTGGSGGGDIPTENVSIMFAAVKTEYFAQNAQGVVATVGNMNYQIAQNKMS